MSGIRPVLGIDLDGTVLDCRPRQQAVLVELCPEARPHLEDIWRMKRGGFSTKTALTTLGLDPGLGFEQRWFDRIEHQDVLKLDPVIAGAEQALDTMHHLADLHLITSRQSRHGVLQTLERLGLSRLFAHIEVVSVGTGAVTAKALHLRTCQAVAHCGDTEVDGAAAQAANLPFWAVRSGQRSGEFLMENTAPAHIADGLPDVAREFEALLHHAVIAD